VVAKFDLVLVEAPHQLQIRTRQFEQKIVLLDLEMRGEWRWLTRSFLNTALLSGVQSIEV